MFYALGDTTRLKTTKYRNSPTPSREHELPPVKKEILYSFPALNSVKHKVTPTRHRRMPTPGTATQTPTDTDIVYNLTSTGGGSGANTGTPKHVPTMKTRHRHSPISKEVTRVDTDENEGNGTQRHTDIEGTVVQTQTEILWGEGGEKEVCTAKVELNRRREEYDLGTGRCPQTCVETSGFRNTQREPHRCSCYGISCLPVRLLTGRDPASRRTRLVRPARGRSHVALGFPHPRGAGPR